jgi:hypothetical protein
MLTINQSQLTRDLSRWGDSVARYVTELGLTAEEAVKAQTGHVMRELADSLPPTSKKRLESRIAGDAKKVFHGINREMFTGKQRGRGDMVWLGASDVSLTGVEKSLYRPGVSAMQMIGIYKARSNKMGNKYLALGYRGVQHVNRIDRVVVKQSALKQFQKIQEAKVGKLKASVALAWEHLAVKGRKPAAWIMRHIKNKTAKGSFTDGLNNRQFPTFTIISNQPGITSNRSKEVISFVLQKRIRAMKADLEKWARKRMKK